MSHICAQPCCLTVPSAPKLRSAAFRRVRQRCPRLAMRGPLEGAIFGSALRRYETNLSEALDGTLSTVVCLNVERWSTLGARGLGLQDQIAPITKFSFTL